MSDSWCHSVLNTAIQWDYSKAAGTCLTAGWLSPLWPTIFLLVLLSPFYVKLLRLQAIILPDTCTRVTQLSLQNIYASFSLENKKTVMELENSLGSNLQKHVFNLLKAERWVLLKLCMSCDFQWINAERLGKASGPSAGGGRWQGLARSLWVFVQENLPVAGAEQVQAPGYWW